MGPADTVDNSSSSPTQGQNMDPQNHTVHQVQAAADVDMDNPGVDLLQLTSNVKSLLQACANIQKTFELIVPSLAGTQSVGSAPSVAAQPPAQVISPPSLPAPQVKVKVAVPDTFTGEIAKSEEFLNSLYLYFYGNPGMTDDAKITFALSYMKGGTAGQWSKRKIQQYSIAGSLPSWDAFLVEFKHTFFDHDPVGTAVHKLQLLKQGNKTCDEYIAAFKDLMDQTKFNDVALMAEFERGLSESIVEKVENLLDAPTTLEKYMEVASKFDRKARRKKAKAKSTPFPSQHTSSHSPSHLTPKQTAPQPPPDVVPMEIDSSSKKPIKKPGPRLCFKCHQPGHIAKYCRSNFDINSMDYASIKAHFRKEIEEEEEGKHPNPDTQEKEKDF